MMLRYVIFILLASKTVYGMESCEDLPPWFFDSGVAVDMPYGPGPPNPFFNAGTLYNAFGQSANDFRSVIYTVIVEGRFEEIAVGGSPSFRFRAAEAGGYNDPDPDGLAKRHYRDALSASDRDELANLLNKAFPCQDDHRIRYGYIATSICLLKQNTRTTYQVAMVTTGTRMYVILNYHMAHNWPPNKYEFVDLVTMTTFPFTGPTPDVANKLLTSTNGFQNGQWIFDVTGPAPLGPFFGPCCTPGTGFPIAGTCRMQMNGQIFTFDGANKNAPAGKSVLARSNTDKTDPCKFMVKVRTNAAGILTWVRFSVGVHPKDNSLFKTHFFFNHPAGDVTIAGFGIASHKINMPKTWTDTQITVNIDGGPSGWRLQGCPCQYSMSYQPQNSQAVSVRVGPKFQNGKVKARCGDFNGIAADDL